ncbi:MAG: helix-turn-helix transcriptional regulator [Rhizobium sp.]|nr:helix-turn-helix transcriptional regulator [Rhizobium sp.]
MSSESISARASRFSHGVPGIGAHGFIMQARSGTFHRLYSDQPALIIVRCGIKRISSSLGSCEATPGQAVALPMGREWTVVNEAADIGGYQADVFTFAPELVEAYARTKTRPPGDTIAFTPDEAMDEALRRLCRSLPERAEPEPVLKHLFGEIIIRLEALGISLLPEHRSTLNDRVRSLVASDISGEWGAVRVTTALGVSEASLRRKLAASGTTLTETIADVRMSRALGLLQTTELPINQVALEVGYGSASKFAARFRERFGLSPRDIRSSEPEIDRTGTEFDRVGAAAE